MEPNELSELSNKVEHLIALCTNLQQENESLRSGEQQWKLERTQLIEKNELARTRVEAMIGRLKALEHES